MLADTGSGVRYGRDSQLRDQRDTPSQGCKLPSTVLHFYTYGIRSRLFVKAVIRAAQRPVTISHSSWKKPFSKAHGVTGHTPLFTLMNIAINP